MEDILEKIAASTRVRVAKEKEKVSCEEMKKMALELSEKEKDKKFPFEMALRRPGMSFICEVKKASPSKGVIAGDFPYVEIAKEYEKAMADCISVLTEPEYFMGNSMYLKEINENIHTPTIRKDFTVDEYMIYEAKVLGASAVLLICSLLDEKTIERYIKICDELGLSALVEAHDEREISMALRAGARIIGVNNRNLRDFTVDINNSIKLRNLVPEEVLFVAESGIKTRDQIIQLEKAGVNGVLIGETFMRSEDKAGMLSRLRGPKIKICGLKSLEDVEYVNKYKPDFAGFVFAGQKRRIDRDTAKKLKSCLDENIKAVGVFVDEDKEVIKNLVNEGIIDMVQLHGSETKEYISRLKESISVPVIEAVRIGDPKFGSIKEQLEYAETTDAEYLLFDTYKDKIPGGSGESFDYSMILNEDVRKTIKKPFFMAGGISVENVGRVMDDIAPYGIDVSSSLEKDGHKDENEIKKFMEYAEKKKQGELL